MASRLDFIKRRRGEAAERGRAGEAIAARYLWWRGFRILHRNYADDDGEIDIIAEDRGVCVFVEVKTRALEAPNAEVLRNPLAAIDDDKQRQIRSIARRYMNRFLPWKFSHRFDEIAVRWDKMRNRYSVSEHRTGAFPPLVEHEPEESPDATERLRESMMTANDALFEE